MSKFSWVEPGRSVPVQLFHTIAYRVDPYMFEPTLPDEVGRAYNYL